MTQRKPPARKRSIFVGVWLNAEEYAKTLQLCRLTGDPDNLSGGLRYALRLANVAAAQQTTEEVQP